ncbi:MAG: alpha/beta fold hydrolase, partial [Acidimicrobiales bacterium]
MTLASHTIGSGPRLVLLHGFTQNSACWGPFAERLATRHQVALVDAPGHGDSRHDDADLDDAARLSVEAGGAGIYVGYSMGGRVALHAALAAPDQVRALVLIGATAGIVDDTERAQRRRADEALADQLAPRHKHPNSGGCGPGGEPNPAGLEGFLDHWLAQPLFATVPPDARHLA